jgi:hypothetical protein
MKHNIGDCFYFIKADCFATLSGIDKFDYEYQAYFEYPGRPHSGGTGRVGVRTMDFYLEYGSGIKLKNNSEQEKLAVRLKYAK